MADNSIPRLVANRYKLLVESFLADLERIESLPPLDEDSLVEEIDGLYEDLFNWDCGHAICEVPSGNGYEAVYSCVPNANARGHRTLRGVSAALQRLLTTMLCVVEGSARF